MEFRTDADTAVFMAGNRDTIRFCIVLKNKDTAHTEIAGIRDLPNSVSSEEKLYTPGRLWSGTKYNFINIDKPGFSPGSLYRAFIPLVT